MSERAIETPPARTSAPASPVMPTASELTDSEAVARCLERGSSPDHAAFRVLYERHGPAVLAFLERLLGDATAAEDALQETFLRLYRGLEGYDAARPLAPYVFRIARNVAIDVLRAHKGERASTSALPESGRLPAARGGSPLDVAVESERLALVEQALGALAPEHRAVLVLRLLHGLKLDDVADALSCSERTARNRLRAASVLLERELRKRGVVGGEATPSGP